MAVRTIAEVTVTDETDIDHLATWYLRSTSPTKPSAPQDGSAPPSPWTSSEPGYDSSLGTTYLYTVTQTVWGDGSLTYGDVQLSSAYEAAKAAYNEASSVRTYATTEFQRTDAAIALRATKEEVDEVAGRIVGRNLFRGTKDAGDDNWKFYGNESVPESGVLRLTPTTAVAFAKYKVDYLDFAEYGSGTFTVSFDVRRLAGEYTDKRLRVIIGFNRATRLNYVLSSTHDRFGSVYIAASEIGTDWTRVSATFDVPEDLNTGRAETLEAGSQLTFEPYLEASGNPVEIRRIKLERGAVATEWSEAPEDYTDEQVSIARAEIKVTTDGITTEVEKKTDKATIISTINQSAETVKIQASKVEIDGTAIFAAISDDVDSAIAGATGPFFSGRANSTGYIHLGHVPYAVNSTSNYSHFHLTGRIGGWTATNSGDIDVTLKSRGGNSAYNTVDRKDDAIDTTLVDVLVYTGTDSYTHYWLKVSGYWYVQLYAEFAQLTEDDHSLVTSAPTGTCTWKLSEQESVASKYADSVAESYANRITSRGEQLVTNGNGFLGDNTNFPLLTFDGSVTNMSPGSFTRTSSTSAEVASEEIFPVDASKQYICEFDVKCEEPGAQMYAFLSFYDVDKNNIPVWSVSYFPSSTTTLARELKNGDTVIYLTSATGWQNTTADHQRSVIIWDYTNSFGYTYPPETYSRNYYSYVYASDSSIDKTNNTITLKSAWTGGTHAAGTYISQNSTGNAYSYFWYCHNLASMPREWTHISSTYTGVATTTDSNPNPTRKAFWAGTAYCKIAFLWNYRSGGQTSQEQGRIWATNISVKENKASATDAVARTQRIYYRKTSSGAPSAPNTWLSTSGTGYGNWSLRVPQLTRGTTKYPYLYTCVQTQTVAQQAAGTACTCSTVLLDDSTTIIDGGSIITGSVAANRLDVYDATIGKISAGAIDTTGITIGQSQVTNLTTDLAAKVGQSEVDAAIGAIEIGGRNLLRYLVYDYADVNNKIKASDVGKSMYCAIDGGETYTVSRRVIEGNRFWIDWSEQEPESGVALHSLSKDNSALEVTVDVPSAANWLFIYLSNQSDVINDGNIKVERGNKATDWTPAPEDVDASIMAVQDDLNATRTWYATCPTASGTAAKVATITPATTDFALAAGVTVAVKFDAANSVANPTLSVNGTDACAIKRYGTTAPSTSAATSWQAGSVATLTYDGTYWQLNNWLNNNDNYYDREAYKAALAASAAISSARIAVLGTDGKLKLLSASAFDTTGPIVYVGTAYSAADATAGTARTNNYTFWGTAFNLTNTHAVAGAAAGKPVYIVGTLSGKTFTPNSTVLTCTIPTSVDNLVYMRLGIMSTTANAVLESQHPLYMYFNGAFQQCDPATADAAKTATNYITEVDANGITIHPSRSDYATNGGRVNVNGTGLHVYVGDDEVAFYGETARLGKSDQQRVEVTSTGVDIYSHDNNRSDLVMRLDINGMAVYDEGTLEMGTVRGSRPGLAYYDDDGTTTLATYGPEVTLESSSGQWQTNLTTDGLSFDYGGEPTVDLSPTTIYGTSGNIIGGEVVFDRSAIMGSASMVGGCSDNKAHIDLYTSTNNTSTDTNHVASISLDTDKSGSSITFDADEVTYSTGSVTTNSSNVTSATTYCHTNRVCTSVTVMNLKLAASLANGSTLNIGTVPSGYRPVVQSYVACAVGGATCDGSVYAYVGTTGAITLVNRSGAALTTSHLIHFTITYIG